MPDNKQSLFSFLAIQRRAKCTKYFDRILGRQTSSKAKSLSSGTLLFSVAKSCLTFQRHELQNARLFCLSLCPWVCSNSCPLSQWRHPTISSSVAPFSSCTEMLLFLKHVFIWLHLVSAPAFGIFTASCGVYCCGARAPEWMGSAVVARRLSMWDLNSPTRDGTLTPCIGRWSLNHWITREFPYYGVFEMKAHNVLRGGCNSSFEKRLESVGSGEAIPFGRNSTRENRNVWKSMFGYDWVSLDGAEELSTLRERKWWKEKAVDIWKAMDRIRFFFLIGRQREWQEVWFSQDSFHFISASCIITKNTLLHSQKYSGLDKNLYDHLSNKKPSSLLFSHWVVSSFFVTPWTVALQVSLSLDFFR